MMKGKHRQPLSLASPCNKCNSNDRIFLCKRRIEEEMSKFPLVKLLILSLMLAVFITMQLWNRLDFFVATPSGGQRASFSSSLSSFPDDDASLSRIEHVQDVLNCTTLKECIEQLTQIFLQKNGDDRCTEIGKTDKNCDKNGNEPHNITAQNKDNSIVKAITESSSERSSPLAQQQQRRRPGQK